MGEVPSEDAKDGRAAIVLLTNWTMNVRAASIFPFSRYLYAKEVELGQKSIEGKGEPTGWYHGGQSCQVHHQQQTNPSSSVQGGARYPSCQTPTSVAPQHHMRHLFAESNVVKWVSLMRSVAVPL